MRMTLSASPPGLFVQVMPVGSGTTTSSLPSGCRAWLTQSCTWNWIQAAARMFSDRAGWNVSRWSSCCGDRDGVGLVEQIGREDRLQIAAEAVSRPRPSPARTGRCSVPSKLRSSRSSSIGWVGTGLVVGGASPTSVSMRLCLQGQSGSMSRLRRLSRSGKPVPFAPPVDHRNVVRASPLSTRLRRGGSSCNRNARRWAALAS